MLIRCLLLLLTLEISLVDCGECLVKRTAKNNGMHRDVVTEIVLIGVSSNPLTCKLLLIEFLPSGLYVDMHQIKNIGTPQVYSTSKMDTEKPEYMSGNHELYVWHHFTMNTSQYTTVLVTLPVHLRYHRPSSEVSASVLLEPPRIFAQCEGSDLIFQRVEGTAAFSPCDANNISSLCEWRELHCSSQPDSHRLEFIVPVGNPDYMIPVVALTLIFTLCGTIVLLYYICTANNTLPPKTQATQSNNSRGNQQNNNSNTTSGNNNINNNKSNNKANAESQQSKSNTNQTDGGSSGGVNGGKSVKNGVSGGSGDHVMKNGGKEAYNLRRRAANK